MTADELARLELARRAFAATRPNEAEVSAGVRRARLALRRSKLPRKSWFGKGLVLVTLAIGGLAYAKPQGVSDMVARLEQAAGFRSHGHVGTGVGEARPHSPQSSAHAAAALQQPQAPVAQQPAAIEQPAAAVPQPAAAFERQATPAPEPAISSGSSRAPIAPSETRAPTNEPAASSANPAAAHTRGGAPVIARTMDEPALETTGSVSSWGRVGQALAKGDEAGALSALSELSASDDPRTRDKADLGRAQLLLAHGQQEQGCALARQLIHRRAGGRIERQALALLKSCER